MSATPQSPKKRKWRRKFLFTLMATVLSVVMLEAFAWIYVKLFLIHHALEEFQHQQFQLANTARSEETARAILHPYFGWVYDADSDPGETFFESDHFPVNDFGFPDDGSSLVEKSEDEISIAILGGSFAQEMSLSASDQLVETLQTVPQFAGRNINVVRLAMSGYKQPQQLIIINYFFAIGAKYDYVINLDGFNEAALPVIQNLTQDIHYSYPRNWHARMKDVVEPEKTSISFRLLSIRAARQNLARDILNAPWNFSALAQLIWKFRDDRLQNELVSLSGDLVKERLEEGRAFLSGGPDQEFASEMERYSAMADLWMRSSQQLKAICDLNGAEYFHFLQPNQYVPNSKPLSAEELESNYGPPDFGTRIVVEECYPLLQERSQKLLDEDIRFTDLTQIFADETQTLYRDKCCHVNPTGYEIVAKAIATELIEQSDSN